MSVTEISQISDNRFVVSVNLSHTVAQHERCVRL